MIQELRDILFLDIETVSNSADFELLDERIKVQWSRKASFLKRNTEQTEEALYQDRAGIYAEFGKIICVAVGKFFETESGELGLKTKVYYGDDEKELLIAFKTMVEKMDPNTLKLCAHNGREFDFPYLCRRMLINEISLPAALNLTGKKPWDILHLDTMEMWKFGDFKHYTSLDLLAAIFDIPTSKSDMDGSQVNQVYHQGKDLERIKAYCIKDVIVLAKVFLKMKVIRLTSELSVVCAD
ncbi:MAG TPA: 3'-5' exonuclease [Chryseolinea sp.]|nr:3'-5' exonuclease [Chryseolinea sp.]